MLIAEELLMENVHSSVVYIVLDTLVDRSWCSEAFVWSCSEPPDGFSLSARDYLRSYLSVTRATSDLRRCRI